MNPFFWCFFGHGNDQNALAFIDATPNLLSGILSIWRLKQLSQHESGAFTGKNAGVCHCFPNLKHPSTITVKNFEVVVYTSTWMQLLVYPGDILMCLPLPFACIRVFLHYMVDIQKPPVVLSLTFWITLFWYVLTTVKALRCQQTMLRNFQYQ
jgi:hypothetical protein